MWVPVSGHQEAYALLMPRSHEFPELVRQRDAGDMKRACAPSCDPGGVALMQGAVRTNHAHRSTRQPHGLRASPRRPDDARMACCLQARCP
eukprot:scaffold4943_cov261-Prasinococcus_capsulatus_cf.AAC.3